MIQIFFKKRNYLYRFLIFDYCIVVRVYDPEKMAGRITQPHELAEHLEVDEAFLRACLERYGMV